MFSFLSPSVVGIDETGRMAPFSAGGPGVPVGIAGGPGPQAGRLRLQKVTGS